MIDRPIDRPIGLHPLSMPKRSFAARNTFLLNLTGRGTARYRNFLITEKVWEEHAVVKNFSASAKIYGVDY